MVISRSWTYAPGYGDLNLGGAEPKKIKSMRILGVTIVPKLTVETHLLEVVSARSLGVVCRSGVLFDYPRVLKSCFNAYVLSSLEYCAPVWMSSAESIQVCWTVLFAVRKGCVRVSFVVRGTEGRSVPCVYSKRFITWPNHPLHEYLHHFVAARNIRASTALCELALVWHCRTDQFSRSLNAPCCCALSAV